MSMREEDHIPGGPIRGLIGGTIVIMLQLANGLMKGQPALAHAIYIFGTDIRVRETWNESKWTNANSQGS